MSAPAVSQSEPIKVEQQRQWNVQVIKGKVTTRCLWNACKALSIGLLLLTLGTSMAVVGYYADQLSIRSETRGNSTVRVKNESRGFHLNNLSYAGPIVMGIGGFIVVAACVMTFEARDNAAKVVPARFKPNPNSSVHRASTKSNNRSRSFQRCESKKNTSCQAGARRDPGTHKFEPGKHKREWTPKNGLTGKKAFTAAFVQLSRELLEKSSDEESCRWHRIVSEANLNKSPSAPDLIADNSASSLRSPRNEAKDQEVAREWSKSSGGRFSGIRPLHDLGARANHRFLRANHLQRQALSMDNSLFEKCSYFTPPSMRLCRRQSGQSTESRDSFEMELGSSAGVSGSQTSMALDLHDCQVTLMVKDESVNRRSDTARRHQLLRQKPVEEDREDKFFKWPCTTRFLFIPKAEDGTFITNSSSNIRTSCHICSQISADFRSKSVSQCPTFRRSGFQDEDPRIFCIEYHENIVNVSSESIKMYNDEIKKGFLGYLSLSLHKSPKTRECRIQCETGSECLIHPGSESTRQPKKYPLVRSNATRRKCNQKIEGSLSAEEQLAFRSFSKDSTTSDVRSASYSPIRNAFAGGSPSRNESFVGSPSPVGDVPPDASKDFPKGTGTGDPKDNNAEPGANEEGRKEQKTCGIEPP